MVFVPERMCLGTYLQTTQECITLGHHNLMCTVSQGPWMQLAGLLVVKVLLRLEGMYLHVNT